jgi:hypothetical protein
MAALTQTPANVKLTTNVRAKPVQYGETITQGQPIYKSTTDSKYYRSDANIQAGQADGIALTPGVLNDFGQMAVPGSSPGDTLINVGATLAVGMVYCVGATAGQIVPYADLTTGDYVTILGVATTTALLDLKIINSGAQKP